MRSGRPPKPEGQKRNRNRPVAEWVVLPKEGRSEDPPALPSHLVISDYMREWWELIWHSPQATLWTNEDVPALVELLLLRQELLGGKTSVAAEVRQRSDEFGLTPAGRKSLRWVIPGDEHEELLPQKKREAVRRQHLQVVDSA